MQEPIIMPAAAKYFKKLKDKKLKKLYQDAICDIAKNPMLGGAKKGDLAGIFSYDISYNGINYELAYKISTNENGELVVVILAGTRSDFYEQLKNYISKSTQL